VDRLNNRRINSLHVSPLYTPTIWISLNKPTDVVSLKLYVFNTKMNINNCIYYRYW